MNLELYTAQVISIDDTDKEGKVKIKISPAHKDIKDSELPWAMPFTKTLYSNTMENELPEEKSIVWVLVQEDWQRFYYIGNRYFYDYFEFNTIISRLNQSTEISGKEYKDLKFKLYKDSGLEFHNNNTGEHGYIHKSGSYTIFDSNGNIITNAKTNKIKVNGGMIELNGNSKVFVTHTELNTALQTMVTSMNGEFSKILATLSAAITAGGLVLVPYVQVPVTLDISTSATTTVKTSG